MFFFKQKTAYEMRISDWSSDVCSSDLQGPAPFVNARHIIQCQPRKDDGRGPEDRRARAKVETPHRQRRESGEEIFPTLAEPVLLRKIGRASCRERVCQYV